eukprot:CAMPEP_0197271544 /NCGR_PEP_ID=MMETSP1432-20130617/8680_1 /TAXON_ID=44447 /ORGANISM="Pseudo-nitzschia delicatissima, Strain UNC1205" /LENGTH=71 /DNA_ID=CAMNT_0042736971 /DNA_START=348 /DNA_END=563 /DNA_ORIENTATION=+
MAEQLGPLAFSDAAKLSSIDVMVGFVPDTGHFCCFGGFLIRMKEHSDESYIRSRSDKTSPAPVMILIVSTA